MAKVARIYLDYNASAPLQPAAREAMLAVLDIVGNPSSVHAEGRRLRGIIEAAREEVAALVHAAPSDVVFTSGATEANVAVISAGWDRIAVSGIEHDSVLAPARARCGRVIDLPVSTEGIVDLAAVEAFMPQLGRPGLEPAAPSSRSLLTVQMANNETGVLQPIDRLAELARSRGVHIHTDAVQAVGRLVVDMTRLGVDTLALSAHKLGGPKGVGALVIRDGVELASLIPGGGQERRRRAGTENVAAIAGFGAAARGARNRLGDMSRLCQLRDRLEAQLLEITPDAVVFGARAPRLVNTSCIGLARQPSEITLIKLDVAGFSVSAGSACSSGRVGISHVLQAMAADPGLARGALRISLGYETTDADIDAFIGAWSTIHSSVPPGSKPIPKYTTTRERPALTRLASGE